MTRNNLQIGLLTGILVVAMNIPLAAWAQSFAVPPELWDRPRSAQAVMSVPAVREAVQIYLANAGARLVIRHARGPESVLFAEELKAWLVALAIESSRITLDASAQISDRLTLDVIP